MKTRLLPTLLFITLFLSAFQTKNPVQAQVHISVYAHIPIAPNVVLTIGTPIIAAPSSNHIWIDSYWTWDNYRHEYVWVQGYWALAPYAGAYWLPGYWECYKNGYRWVAPYWTPRNFRLRFGYYDGRYDYYGRPVYYHQPDNRSRGYAYGYDHNSKHRDKRYNSSPYFNESPRKERDRINNEYKNSKYTSNKSSRQTASRKKNDNSYMERKKSGVTTQRQTTEVENHRTSVVNIGRTRAETKQETANSKRGNKQENSINTTRSLSKKK